MGSDGGAGINRRTGGHVADYGRRNFSISKLFFIVINGGEQ